MIFQEGVGIQCSLTMIDLILDNRAIVDCMREKDINLIVKLLSQIKVNKFDKAQNFCIKMYLLQLTINFIIMFAN